jgi:hypothetical protein
MAKNKKPEVSEPKKNPAFYVLGVVAAFAALSYFFFFYKPANQDSQNTPSANTSQTAPQQASNQTTAPAPNFRMPPYFENPDSEPLAPTLDPAIVPASAKAGYLIAQKKPKLLAQLPCFCYCDRFGHKSLHDCYSGTHAAECDVCLNEAIEADQMSNQGMSPQAIRSVIVAKYHPHSN